MNLEWKESMSTGVKEIDDAHKTLIKGINTLNSAMKSGNGRQEILKILDFLGKYAAMHFAHEESCMQRYQCPAAHINKVAHDQFLKFFGKMKNEIETNGATVTAVLEIHGALSDWLKTHIMKIDIGLASCVSGNNSESSVAA